MLWYKPLQVCFICRDLEYFAANLTLSIHAFNDDDGDDDRSRSEEVRKQVYYLESYNTG